MAVVLAGWVAYASDKMNVTKEGESRRLCGGIQNSD
jgi:hypothetical protein